MVSDITVGGRQLGKGVVVWIVDVVTIQGLARVVGTGTVGMAFAILGFTPTEGHGGKQREERGKG